MKEPKKESTLKKIAGIGFWFFFALVIPVSVWVVLQETQTRGKAVFETPDPIVPALEEAQQEIEPDPLITLVWPFLGKVGDAVLINGEGFGEDFENATLQLGSETVTAKDINVWTPELIEFTVPQMPTGTISESSISITVDEISTIWDFPFTIYDFNTSIQVEKPNGYMIVSNAPPESTVKAFFEDGSTIQSQQLSHTEIPAGKTVISVEILNITDNPITFYVEPTEFGF